MEQETLFTASKWNILTELRRQPRSPKELAELLGTSVANISQQLRLLEMAGLVESKRVSNREKGLPRVLYSLSGNHSYLIATAKEFVDKKFHELTERNKVVLRIWFLDDPSIHYYLEKAFWKIDEYLTTADSLLLDQSESGMQFTIVSENEDIEKKLDDLEITNPDGETRTVGIEVFTPGEFEDSDKNKDNYSPLYDPKSILNGDHREDKDTDDGDKK